MSETITAKAGGTSNRNAEAVLQSMHWAEQSDIFVVSAPGDLGGDAAWDTKVTKMLKGTRADYRAGGDIPVDTTDMITDRYASIVSGLGELTLPRKWIDKITPRIEEAARNSMDAVSMLGERLQAEIYEAAGYTLLDPGRAPHNLGSDPDAWRGWLGSVYRRGNRYVMPGNTTLVAGHLETFDTGGSDISGGLAAYGIEADLNLNLTDDSALSADPRFFRQEDRGRLVRIGHLLYEEGRELGRNGTGLVHPDAMVPLMIGNIPTEVRSTSDRSASPTLLDNDRSRAEDRKGKVIALSLMKDVTMHRVYEPGMEGAVGRLAAFETALSEHDIAVVDSQGDGVDAQKYFVDTRNAETALVALSGVTRGSIETSDSLSFITLVGYRLDKRLFDNILGVALNPGLRGKDWQTEDHDFSPGRHSLRISVRPDEALAVLKSLHSSFIENA